MGNYCIMRIKKLHTNANIGGAISHHLRTRETDNADPELMTKNFFLPNEYGRTPSGHTDTSKNADREYRLKQQSVAMARYKKRLPERIRKNAVRAVEFMMTVSPEVLQRKDFNSIQYLNKCTDWAFSKFGNENVFFVAYHFDEKTPHVSLLLTPIDENGKLNARKFFGTREKLSALQDSFYEEVGKKFGLERGQRGSKAKHQSIKQYYSKINKMETLERENQGLQMYKHYAVESCTIERGSNKKPIHCPNGAIKALQTITDEHIKLVNQNKRLEDILNSPEALEKRLNELNRDKNNGYSR